MKKVLIFALFFYILALVQSSFLFHFDVFSITPNLILISVFLLNFLEKPGKKSGFLIAGIGGFFLDLFSNFQLGASILALVILVLLVKKVLNFWKEENVVYFIPTFIFFVIFYNLFSVLFNSVLTSSFPPSFVFSKLEVFGIFYNLIWGVLGYFLVKICFQKVLRK